MNAQVHLNRLIERLNRPVSAVGMASLALLFSTVPAVLCFDSLDNVFHPGHIFREPMAHYRLWSDDVAYTGVGRSWHRTIEYLFIPHNTHVVPTWRVVTRVLVGLAGSLERLADVYAVASYGILLAAMFLMYRIVAREASRAYLGFLALILLSTTSVLLTPVCWYSAGQPLWAGFGILAALWYSQSYRRSGRPACLVLAAVAAVLGGWCWTIGHMAGPVCAVYLWMDGRRRNRIAAVVPLGATIFAVILSVIFGFVHMDSTLSLHGRSTREAFNPLIGLVYTGQSVPETLVLANLGLNGETNGLQGAVLTGAILFAWLRCGWRKVMINGNERYGFDVNPLELAGLTLVFGSYAVEWSFRSYLPFSMLRTIGLRAIVPWYDAIPHIGGVLFIVGWMMGPKSSVGPPAEPSGVWTLTRSEALRLLLLSSVMYLLNSPRVEELVRRSVPAILDSERKGFAELNMQTMRANAILSIQGAWQRAALRRLDRAELIAKRAGIGRDAIREALGHPFLVGSFATRPPSEHRELYDAVALLDLPDVGRKMDPAAVRALLAQYFVEEPEPRPEWIGPSIPWPPTPTRAVGTK